MKTQEFQIVEPGRIELREREMDAKLGAHEALVKTQYSIVSAGTEGATFTGLVNQMPSRDPQAPRAAGRSWLGCTYASRESPVWGFRSAVSHLIGVSYRRR